MKAGLERAGQPVKRGSMAHDHELYMTLTDTAAQTRDLLGLQEYTPKLEELARRDGHTLYLGIAERAHGVAHRLTGDYDSAYTHFQRAVELFTELGTRWQLARTLSELGELAMARGNVDAARENYARALEHFETLGALPDVERTRALL